jgi:predicted RNase H-like HicB family nuclease
MQSSYTYRIMIEADEDATYHGYVPALTGCHTWGKTIQETRSRLQDAMKAYIQSLIDDGEPVPEEHGIEALETDLVIPPKGVYAKTARPHRSRTH